jgi:hypothetical protein
MMYVSIQYFNVCFQVHGGASMFHCRKASFFTIWLQKLHAHFHMCLCIRNVSYFGIHLAQILWYLKSSWMIEYAYPQMVSSLSAISVTVICLSSWTITLTHSTLSASRKVVAQPKQSPSTMLVLPLWNLFTHWYTFLCMIVFSVLC